MRMTAITLLVRDYDEALTWFCERLGFFCVENTALGQGKRWVVVCPEKDGTSLLLARPSTPAQWRRIGRQGEGRVMFFLATDNFERSYARFRASRVRFLERPRREPYGRVVKFEDLYGNRWDLIEPVNPRRQRARPSLPR